MISTGKDTGIDSLKSSVFNDPLFDSGGPVILKTELSVKIKQEKKTGKTEF